jgi:alpha-glucosidase
VRGRDGCRVPLPWSGAEPPYGFSANDDATPWLPQPAGWGERSVELLDGDPESILSLYRTALRLRRRLDALGDGALQWLEGPAAALMFSRQPGFACVVNFGRDPIPLPPGGTVILSSGPLEGEQVPTDVAVWLEVAD